LVFIGAMIELFHGEKWAISSFLLNMPLNYDLLNKKLKKSTIFWHFL